MDVNTKLHGFPLSEKTQYSLEDHGVSVVRSCKMLSVVCFEHIGHFADGHEGFGIDGVDDVAHTGDPETVDNKVNDAFFAVGVAAFGGDFGGAAFKGRHKRVADLVGFFGRVRIIPVTLRSSPLV